MKLKRRGRKFNHVFPEIENWPIYKLSEDRENFIAEIVSWTTNQICEKYNHNLHEVLTRTAYLELIRIKEEPWKVDPPNEKVFWKKLQSSVAKNALKPVEVQQKLNKELLNAIIHRYTEEIVGTFKISTFKFARRFLNLFFNRLLNTAAGRNMRRVYGNRHRLEDKLLVKGEIEKVRELMKKGTVVILPTHFSNLDSILIGYALDAFAGLPSFSYGAGLNLYNTGYTAYFMNRLGAYRVDRRKKNPIYLETLKAMSSLSIQRGVNSLFFPGGTRSRTGALENQLKLGLLGTVTEAQRTIFERGSSQKIFVVPLVLSYHFVLESKFLIEQHLRKIGKEKYLRASDDFYSIRKNLKFIWSFFSESNEITLSFGKPMDVLGNLVDENGTSFDQKNRKVEVKEYFMTKDKVSYDKQRENEYTRHLATKVVERFFEDNIVLTSHLVARIAFKMLEKQNQTLDLYGILRLPTEDFEFNLDVLKALITQAIEYLMILEKNNKIRLSEELFGDVDSIINDGVKKIGTYHKQKPLKFTKQGKLISEHFPILYYYHNRLEGYEIENHLDFSILQESATKLNV